MTTNTYSPDWFVLFSDAVPADQTAREVAFLCRQLKVVRLGRVLDLCCGGGRHAGALAQCGYDVIGVDRDAGALRRALQAATAAAAGRCRFLRMDARDIASLDPDQARLEAILCMWQSFGYFPHDQNLRLLRDLAGLSMPGGRLVLDIYNADFFRAHPGARYFERAGRPVVEHKSLQGDRLRVELTYADTGARDVFDWQVFSPDELAAALCSAGWGTLLSCRDFKETQPPAAEHPRMQMVAMRSPRTPK